MSRHALQELRPCHSRTSPDRVRSHLRSAAVPACGLRLRAPAVPAPFDGVPPIRHTRLIEAGDQCACLSQRLHGATRQHGRRNESARRDRTSRNHVEADDDHHDLHRCLEREQQVEPDRRLVPDRISCADVAGDRTLPLRCRPAFRPAALIVSRPASDSTATAFLEGCLAELAFRQSRNPPLRRPGHREDQRNHRQRHQHQWPRHDGDHGQEQQQKWQVAERRQRCE